MSTISFICTAADSKSIYGLAIGTEYPPSGPLADHLVLVKSEPGALSVLDIVWSAVSYVSKNDTSIVREAACAISDQGVFTAIGPGSTGIRYNPGPRVWSNIIITETEPDWWKTGSILFYTTGATPSLVMASVSFPETINFRVMDEPTQTLSSATSWTLSGIYSPTIRHVGFGNNQLYVYARDVSFSTLTGYPFTGVTKAQPTNHTVYDARNLDDCEFRTFTYGGFVDNTYYLVCVDYTKIKAPLLFNVFNTSVMMGIRLKLSSSYMDPRPFTPTYMDPFQVFNGLEPFGFFQYHDEAYSVSFHFDGDVSGPVKMTITPSSNGMSPATRAFMIVGIVVGIMAMIAGITYYYRQRRSRDEVKGAEDETEGRQGHNTKPLPCLPQEVSA